MNNKVLVTGGNGQLGKCLQAAAAHSQDKWIYKGSSELDITDPQAIAAACTTLSPDVIVNCAAYTAVDKAESEQEQADAINHLGASYLGDACRNFGVKLIHISTDFVYDGTYSQPKAETSPTSPLGMYGRTKLMGEKAIMEKAENAIIIRTSWLYSGIGHNFFKTMYKLASEDKNVNVVADQFGTPTHALDLAHAICQIIASPSFASASGVFNYSNLGTASWYDFAHEIFSAQAKTQNLSAIRTDQYPTPAARPAFTVMDKSKVIETFDLSIPHWRDSLDRELKSYTTE